ncbi:MAG: tRNA (adenosine(37)-N6)-threonylcarbamoyltransferase complex ATPase subunit type 1 TsaE [Nodosilinea sp.]
MGEFGVDLPNAAATHWLGRRLGQLGPPGLVLLLSGDLGMGKTTLVQGIGKGLGIEDPISSPTFTLINEYLEGRIPLYHVDLYRLDSVQVESLELEDYWDGGELEAGILAIEWAERMLLPPAPAISIGLESTAPGGRRAMLRAGNAAQVTFLEQVVGDGLLVDEV